MKFTLKEIIDMWEKTYNEDMVNNGYAVEYVYS